MTEKEELKARKRAVCIEPGANASRGVAKDPRRMSQADLEVAHERMSPLKALRLRCLDCCGGGKEAVREVRLCVVWDCPAWPFRMRTNPWRDKKVMTDEQKARLGAGLAKHRAEQAGKPAVAAPPVVEDDPLA